MKNNLDQKEIDKLIDFIELTDEALIKSKLKIIDDKPIYDKMDWDDIALTSLILRRFFLDNDKLKLEKIRDIVGLHIQKSQTVKKIHNNINNCISDLNDILDSRKTMIGFEKNDNSYILKIGGGPDKNITNREWFNIYLYGWVFHNDYDNKDYQISRRDLHKYMKKSEDTNILFLESINIIVYCLLRISLIISINVKLFLHEFGIAVDNKTNI